MTPSKIVEGGALTGASRDSLTKSTTVHELSNASNTHATSQISTEVRYCHRQSKICTSRSILHTDPGALRRATTKITELRTRTEPTRPLVTLMKDHPFVTVPLFPEERPV